MIYQVQQQPPLRRIQSRSRILWIVFYFISITFSLYFAGCGDDTTQGDRTRPLDWVVIWSYTINAELNKGTQSHWVYSFQDRDQCDINTALSYRTRQSTPSDDVFDWTDETSMKKTTAIWLRQWHQVTEGRDDHDGIDSTQIDIALHSILAGIVEPPGTPSDRYGVTIARDQLDLQWPVATSLIFQQKIYDIQINGRTIDAAQAANVMDALVVHELGHARGLNSAFDGDHTGHCSASTCIMKNPISTSVTPPFYFCDHHTRILKQCLQASILSTYNTGDACAQCP